MGWLTRLCTYMCRQCVPVSIWPRNEAMYLLCCPSPALSVFFHLSLSLHYLFSPHFSPLPFHPPSAAQIHEKYEKAHHSNDATGIKTLDFFVKKKTDHYNNLINTWVGTCAVSRSLVLMARFRRYARVMDFGGVRGERGAEARMYCIWHSKLV